MHSCGPVAEVGSMPTKPGNISLVMSMPICVSAMRGSVCSVAVSGGGQGFPASHVRNERLVVSLAKRKLKAVEPVRGSPSPNSGATISCSLISGCCAYHLLHLEPVHEQADDLVDHDALAQLVERRFRRERIHEDVEALPPGISPEILRTRPFHRGLDQLFDA
jgi:hypothetical protein